MNSLLLLKGCLIGFSIAMPVGPIGLLCIRNSLTKGMKYGLTTGLGAACADTLYGALGGFGLYAIALLLVRYRVMLELFGALFLLYLGASTFFEKIEEKKEMSGSEGYARVFFSTFLLTLTNPMTIISFVGIYAGLGGGDLTDGFLALSMITVGVFMGSAFWWLLLSFGSSCLRKKMNTTAHVWLNRISGAIIFGFGIVAIFDVAGFILPKLWPNLSTPYNAVNVY